MVTVGVALACVAGGISAGVLYCFSTIKSLAAKKIPRAQESRQLRRLVWPGYFNP